MSLLAVLPLLTSVSLAAWQGCQLSAVGKSNLAFQSWGIQNYCFNLGCSVLLKYSCFNVDVNIWFYYRLISWLEYAVLIFWLNVVV
jgi:hypothetical protein